MRHNEIRDILGKLISEVSTSTRIEPPLQPVTGETFVRQSTTREDDARPDIYARGRVSFGAEGLRMHFSMLGLSTRTHPHTAASNSHHAIAELKKKRSENMENE